MTHILEKLFAVIVAFCFGCYITADYLDRPFVEQQKKKIKEQFEKLLLSTDKDTF